MQRTRRFWDLTLACSSGLSSSSPLVSGHICQSLVIGTFYFSLSSLLPPILCGPGRSSVWATAHLYGPLASSRVWQGLRGKEGTRSEYVFCSLLPTRLTRAGCIPLRKSLLSQADQCLQDFHILDSGSCSLLSSPGAWMV